MKSKTVLLVDDSTVSINVLKHMVIRAGLTPVIAHCKQDAVVLCETSANQNFFCALVDYHLPDAPNGEAIDTTLSYDIPTIAVTGKLTEATREDILRRHVVDYIPKENIQIYTYLKYLLNRLQQNHEFGILLVGSVTESNEGLVRLLSRHYFSLFEASTTEEATQILARNPQIKLVVLNDDIGDSQLLSYLVDTRCDYPLEQLIIFGLLNKKQSGLEARLIKSGASDVLTMPICHEMLLSRLYQNLERLEHSTLLRTYANTDPLTQLNNRRYFFEQLEEYGQPPDSMLALAIIDIDHFKQINDQHGHQAGDELLKQFSVSLRHVFADYLVARVGGEEFCVFLFDKDEGECRDLLSHYLKTVRSGVFPVANREINITVSIGVAVGTEIPHEELYRYADQALYQAKNTGRNQLRTHVFDDG